MKKCRITRVEYVYHDAVGKMITDAATFAFAEKRGATFCEEREVILAEFEGATLDELERKVLKWWMESELDRDEFDVTFPLTWETEGGSQCRLVD